MTKNDAYDCGRLLHYMLDADARATSDREYSRLINRYRNEYEFGRAVDDMLEGLELEVIESDHDFLQVDPTQRTSPFADLGLLLRANTTEDRLLHCLAMVGVIATIFPTPRSIEDSAFAEDPLGAGRPITTDEIYTTIKEAVERFQKERGDGGSMSNDEYDLKRMADVYAELAERRSDRKAFRTQRGWIDRVCRRAVERGYLVKLDNEGRRYRPTRPFYARLQHASGHRLVEIFRAYQHAPEDDTADA